jgi:predicted O-methyltransferase YrrM
VHRARSIATYVLKGSPLRRSRLHNARGELVDARGLLHLPHCVATTIRLKVTGRRPELPWLGYRAVRHLDALIEPSWNVLEFGSGMSTIWFARRCRFVLSCETDEGWYAAVRELVDQSSLGNVENRFCSTRGDHTDYDTAVSEHRGVQFDLVLVDGARRDLAMGVGLQLVKAGGYVFLDNTDLPNADCRIAAEMLDEAAGPDAPRWVFNDFSPGVVMVNEGTLVRIGEPSPSRS